MLLSNADQIRSADQIMIEEHQFPGLLLMETAGRKVAERILERWPFQSCYLVLAGPGNNGGDGWVIARYLLLAGKEVKVFCPIDPAKLKGDAAINFQAVKKKVEWFQPEVDGLAALIEGLPNATLLIDALLGTGINGPLRPPFDQWASLFDACDFPVAAVDMPSGLSADSGRVFTPPVKASVTYTFQLPKICHAVFPAADYCGEVEVVDIGIWQDVIENLGIFRQVTDVAAQDWLTPRPQEGHKGTFGHALLMGGTGNMAGAIALSGEAALSIGTGLVTCLVPGAVRCAFYRELHGMMTAPQGDDSTPFLGVEHLDGSQKALEGKASVAIGPGLGQEESTGKWLKAILPSIQVPLVLDADALNILAANPEIWDLLPENTILTPHPGEMRRLLEGNFEMGERLETAEKLAKDRKVIVVLKGAGTVIAAPDGRTFVNPTGNPGMGTAGMGDLLTGAICGLLAQGLSPFQAAVTGVFVHGLAGDSMAEEWGHSAVTASGLLPWLGKALDQVKSAQNAVG